MAFLELIVSDFGATKALIKCPLNCSVLETMVTPFVKRLECTQGIVMAITDLAPAFDKQATDQLIYFLTVRLVSMQFLTKMFGLRPSYRFNV